MPPPTRPGPTAPTTGSVARLWPLTDGPAELDDESFWGGRQRRNTGRSIPAGLGHLATGGQLDDLRRAAGTHGGAHTGRPYSDSDVYKMAEALAWSGTSEGLAGITGLVTGAQRADGYVHSWTSCGGGEPFADLGMGHEMYNGGHLIQAAVAEHRALGGTGLLGAATAFADLLVRRFGAGGADAVCGHPEIEMALVELHRLTGREEYLALARRMVDLRGRGLLGPGRYGAAYYGDDVPVRAATGLDGHCVRALYLAAGATDVYLETGEPALLAALERQWADTVATKTYITGGVGCRRKTEAFGAPFELPPDQAFNETCAGVANVLWSWRMLLATGEGRYADHIERVLFNVVAAGVSLDGDAFSYTNSLHRRGSAMEVGDKAPYRKPWFHCACCPPNVMRLLASLGHYVATTDAGGVQLHQYSGGTVTAGGFRLAVRTTFPWYGRIEVVVEAAPERERTLSLRRPGWCPGAVVRLGDRVLDLAPTPAGYLAVHRLWRPGDQLVLELDMPPRLVRPDPRIDAVRGCAAIERGPLVYCLEDADLPPGVRLDEVVLAGDAPPRATPAPDLLGGTVTVQAQAWRVPAPPPAPWPYGAPAGTAAGTAAGAAEPLTVTAVPYHLWDNRGMGQMRVFTPVRD